MTNFHKLLFSSASLALLCLAFAVIWGAAEFSRTNRQLRSTLNEAQWMISEARPELKETLKQAKILAFESRGELKGFLEDFNSAENMRGRRSTMRAGESVAALAARIEADTLPILNQSLRRSDEAIDAARVLLANADRSLNRELVPEAKALLVSLRGTADALGVDSRAVLAELTLMAKQGAVTLEGASKVLASSQWESILANIEKGTFHVAETTALITPSVQRVLDMLARAERWQKPLLIVQLITSLARVIP